MGASIDVREINGSDMISSLRLSQQAPAILDSTKPKDTAEHYGQMEQLLLACLRTGDDHSAQVCLDRLSQRFGPSNERIMALRGLYQEATAKDPSALEKCLEDYDKILSENAVNIVRTPVLAGRIED